MRNPLWMLNTSVIVALIILVVYIIFSWHLLTQVPPATPIKPAPAPEVIKKEGPKPQDIQVIYQERDLFNTYKPAPPAEQPAPAVLPLPQPPTPTPLVLPQPPAIQFLEPLPIKISAIATSTNEANSQVSILNTQTKKTESYHVGDKILDAYIIKIFPKKIILIRSNGQQETLFMYPEDAQAEIRELQDPSWTDVVQQQSQTYYIVDPTRFVERVNNLAHFIDMLDVTTAFSHKTVIGCRIGNMNPKSLGYSLGFMPGDIITSINGIEPTTTAHRVAIYNAIASLNRGDQVTVHVLRQGTPFNLTYTLHQLQTPAQEPVQASSQEQAPQSTAQPPTQPVPDAAHITNEKQKVTPIAHSLKKQDKQAIMHYGSKNSVLRGL